MADATVLRQSFPLAELEWKVQTSGMRENRIWARIVPYVTARAIIDRLDEGFGAFEYSIEFSVLATEKYQGLKCRIVAITENGPIAREDVCELGGGQGDIDQMKTAASGALKRAAVHFGIGAYLYHSPDFYAVIGEKGQYPNRASHKVKGTDTRHDYSWDLPAEVYQWAGEAPPSTTPKPSQQATQPPPAWVAPAKQATPAPTGGALMPGKDTFWGGWGTKPIGDVPTKNLRDAETHYQKKANEGNKYAIKDIAIVQAELAKRGPEPEEPEFGDEPDFDDDQPY